MQRLDLESSKNGVKASTVKKKKFLTQIVCDFAENTTLNGLKYMVDGPSVIEKLFWFVTFVLSAVLCSFMVYKTYVKWESSAVHITLNERLVSVKETPFPAVTICPQAKIKQEYYSFFGEYENYLQNKTPELRRLEDIKFHSAMVLCQQNISTELNIIIPPITLLKTIRMIAPKHSDVFESCEWRGKSCKNQFREVLTADGLCYTFNTLSRKEIYRKTSEQYKWPQYYLNAFRRQKDWSLDTNTYNSSGYVYPRRGRANGLREDLHIVLKEIKDQDFYCEKHTRPGYKVYLHHPADPPQATLHYYAAHPERTTSLAVKLNILTTSDEVRRYDPDVRQCYFPSERQLKYFETYTQKNCQLECFSTFTYNLCRCVDFYMPRDNTTDICSAPSVNCMKKALDQYILNETFVRNCGCLPSCYDIQYDADVIATKFDQEEYNLNKKWLLDLESEVFEDVENGTTSVDEDSSSSEDEEEYVDDEGVFNCELDVYTQACKHFGRVPVVSPTNFSSNIILLSTEIRIYYRQPEFVAMVRSELFGLSQFLGDCGGTLGLFLGFSVLTFAEIFYFFTLKLFCNLRRERIVEKIEKSNDINDIEGKFKNVENQNA